MVDADPSIHLFVVWGNLKIFCIDCVPLSLFCSWKGNLSFRRKQGHYHRRLYWLIPCFVFEDHYCTVLNVVTFCLLCCIWAGMLIPHFLSIFLGRRYPGGYNSLIFHLILICAISFSFNRNLDYEGLLVHRKA